MFIDKKSILEELKEFISLANLKINGSKHPRLASFSFKIPPIRIPKIINSKFLTKKDFFYWKINFEEIEFIASDPLVNFNEYGEERLIKTSDRVKQYENNFISNWGKNNLKFAPIVLGGIKFAPDQHSRLWKNYSDSDWFIPKFLFFKQKDSIFFIYNFINSDLWQEQIERFEHILRRLEKVYQLKSADNSEPMILSNRKTKNYSSWKQIVDEALNNINEGLMSKVVLSRQVNYKLGDNIDLSLILDNLALKYPRCYTFAFRRSSSVFFGASPEKLAKISDNWIEVDALAGSVPRGKNQDEDLKLQNFLLSSKKNLFEQRAVVNFIHNLLSKFSDEIIYNDKPSIRKLPNIQHLWTVIKARLKEDFRVLDLLMKVHPTPAICGDPWRIAKDFILEMEPHDRGLYSGNIGWFNFNGNGEFAVGIRTALITRNHLYAYAGCGIVEGSEAEAEFDESEIKLKPILSLFSEE